MWLGLEISASDIAAASLELLVSKIMFVMLQDLSEENKTKTLL